MSQQDFDYTFWDNVDFYLLYIPSVPFRRLFCFIAGHDKMFLTDEKSIIIEELCLRCNWSSDKLKRHTYKLGLCSECQSEAHHK